VRISPAFIVIEAPSEADIQQQKNNHNQIRQAKKPISPFSLLQIFPGDEPDISEKHKRRSVMENKEKIIESVPESD
jgi:hypothetical protein